MAELKELQVLAPDIAMELIQSEARTQELQLQSGWLGRLFGSGENALIHTVGFLCTLLIVGGIIYTFCAGEKHPLPPTEFWKLISPLITALMGFLFGTGMKFSRPETKG